MWFTAKQLHDFDTITESQADDLKWEGTSDDGTPMRLWLSRCGIADGEPFPHTVTVEIYDVPDDEEYESWHEVARYDGDRPVIYCQYCGCTQMQPLHPLGHLCDEHYNELCIR